MYQNEYHLYVVCKASQVVSMNHNDQTIEYGEIDEIYENEHYQIFDVTNNQPVADINWLNDDEAVYKAIDLMIKEYEVAMLKEGER